VKDVERRKREGQSEHLPQLIYFLADSLADSYSSKILLLLEHKKILKRDKNEFLGVLERMGQQFELREDLLTMVFKAKYCNPQQSFSKELLMELEELANSEEESLGKFMSEVRADAKSLVMEEMVR
jgi:hypothetical protein